MLKLHGYLRNNAILQRNETFFVKGYSDTDVVISIQGGEYKNQKSANVVCGEFKVEFEPISDTKNTFLISVANEKEELSINVLFGDVYFTMGQSNMSYSIEAVENCDNWIRRFKARKISVLSLDEDNYTSTEEVKRSFEEQSDFTKEYNWITSNENSKVYMAAIPLQFAAIVAERTKVPVGIVNLSMGGLSVESYVSRNKLENDPDILDKLKKFGRYVDKSVWNNIGTRNYTQMSGMWNDKVHPLIDVKVKGVVWYLGESSAYDYEFAIYHKKCMTILINEMKKYFFNPAFVMINIAPEYYPYGDSYGYLYINEVMDELSQEFENVYNIPIYDIEPKWLKLDGNDYYHPIHTVNKDLVSERAANVFCNGRKYYPRIGKLQYYKDRIVAEVDFANSELRKEEYRGFTIAGKNGVYYPAQAKPISYNQICIQSIDVKNPKYICYSFMQYSDYSNVTTIDEAPLVPYRSIKEPVNKKYFFTPAYLTKGATQIYENNFGHNVGMCHKVDVWTNGKIYRSAPVDIKVHRNGKIVLKATPQNKDLFYFGISPEICLCGHKNYFDRFSYLIFNVKANKECTFDGFVVKLSDGSIYKFYTTIGANDKEVVSISDQFMSIAIDLNRAMRGDSSLIALSKKEKSSIVEVEFIFRSKNPVEVVMDNLNLTNINYSKEVTFNSTKKISRSDIVLPDINK